MISSPVPSPKLQVTSQVSSPKRQVSIQVSSRKITYSSLKLELKIRWMSIIHKHEHNTNKTAPLEPHTNCRGTLRMAGDLSMSVLLLMSVANQPTYMPMMPCVNFMHIKTRKANPGSGEDPKVDILNFLHSHFSFNSDAEVPGVPKRPYDTSFPHTCISICSLTDWSPRLTQSDPSKQKYATICYIYIEN